jgi:hypothetical protein
MESAAVCLAASCTLCTRRLEHGRIPKAAVIWFVTVQRRNDLQPPCVKARSPPIFSDANSKDGQCDERKLPS